MILHALPPHYPSQDSHLPQNNRTGLMPTEFLDFLWGKLIVWQKPTVPLEFLVMIICNFKSRARILLLTPGSNENQSLAHNGNHPSSKSWPKKLSTLLIYRRPGPTDWKRQTNQPSSRSGHSVWVSEQTSGEQRLIKVSGISITLQGFIIIFVHRHQLFLGRAINSH